MSDDVLIADEVNKNHERHLILRGREGAKPFKRFEVGVGWLNAKLDDKTAQVHHLVVIGEMIDGRLAIVEEHNGPMGKICDLAVEVKDRLLATRFHVDSSDKGLTRDLRNYEGLCTYYPQGKDRFDRERYPHEPSHWAYFRYREHRASVVPVLERERVHFQSELDRIRSAVDSGDTIFVDRIMQLRRVMREDLDRMLEHPLMRAAVWVHSAMLRTKEVEEPSGLKRAKPMTTWVNPIPGGR